MRINSLTFIFLSLFMMPLYAEVYKCDDEGSVRYSTTPCSNQLIDLELTVETIPDDNLQEERFITPSYPTWSKGWKKSKDLKLERFFEVVYEAVQPSESQKSTRINQQKLTNLPQSMSVQRFAVSVEDIIESICANAVVYQPKMSASLPKNVFYGQYVCSFRRDTKQGELGYFKIMRGKNSIYMMAVKWAVEPFKIEEDTPLAITETELQKAKIKNAHSYLTKHVKLCRAEKCW